MVDELVCDVCRKNKALGVASSSLGAVSHAYCRECLENHADCDYLFQFVLDMVDGDIEKLNPSIKLMNTYKDGEYISFEKWAESYVPTSYPDNLTNDIEDWPD